MTKKAILDYRSRRESGISNHPFFKENEIPEIKSTNLGESQKKKMSAMPMRPPVLSGLEVYNGPWGIAQAAHLLRRTGFGAKYTEAKRLANMSVEDAISEVMTPFSNPLSKPVNDYFGDVNDDDVAPGEPFTDAPYNDEVEGNRIWSMKGWWLRRMINQDTKIAEKMMLFWHNHIPIQFYGIFNAKWNYGYFKLLHTYSLGNFKEMMRAVTIDTAMLFYLNGQENSKQQPDENYARELQELFCVGKGPESKFTEEDVQAMARVLTGWRYNWNNQEVEFATWAHDTDDKQLSSFYNNAVIDGRSGIAGQFELDDLLDVIFDNNEVANFLCRKLYRFFVYHDIDADTEANIIQPLAEIFRNNDYEIAPVMDILIRSQHFFDAANQGAMVKAPIDYQVALCKEFNVQFPDPSELSENYQMSGFMSYFLELLQQSPGDPPNVAGWPAYYQLPQFDKQWISTDTLPKRLQLSDYMLRVGIESDNAVAKMDIIGTAMQFDNPSDPVKLIDDAIEWLYGIEVSQGVKSILKSGLLSGQSQDYYWTVAWDEFIADPDDEMKRNTVLSRLNRMFRYLLRLEEFQLS